MAMPFIPSQSFYFYTNAWSQEMDRYFIHSFMSYKNENGRDGSLIPSHELKRARREINSHFGSRITEEEIIQRVELLVKRFRSFNFVRERNGVHFDEDSGRIMATDGDWEKMFKINQFAKAYYHNGEPEFMRPSILFGSDDIIQEQDNNFIHVDEDDEVTSPVPISTRRKLFDSKAMDINNDQESTTNMNPQHLRGASSQRFPPPYKGNRSLNLFKNMYSSSCGSCSPSPSSKK